MINKIVLNGVATYEDETTMLPTKINYIYGGNGTGKTTISKVINNISEFPKCKLEWENEKLDILVYNQEFVKKNFEQNTNLNGIFTLGSDTIEAQRVIKEKKEQLEKIKTQLLTLNTTQKNKKDENTQCRKDIEEKCWESKKKHSEKFKDIFAGFNNSKDKFCTKCLDQSNNLHTLIDENTILEKYKNLYSNDLQKYEMINNVDLINITKYDDNSLLAENIIGKDDVSTATLIKKLNNSDWVKQGVDLYQESNGVCPFCQQNLNEKLFREIKSFFDESYQNKIDCLKKFKNEYSLYFSAKIKEFKLKINKEIKIIDFTNYEKELELIDSLYKLNLSKIEDKLKYPSNIIELEKIENKFTILQKSLEEYIEKINNNNEIVKNLKSEKEKLNFHIWEYIFSELKNDIEKYNSNLDNCKKAITSLDISIKSTTENIKTLNDEIKEKEAQITSVQHSVNEINKILELFGFTNFKLSKVEDDNSYKIIRGNGEDGKESLSEGEYTFITFLYFYQLIKGSLEKSGVAKEQIIVIDDPISSLDSNVLSVISSLIRELVEQSHKDKNGIKQIFLLTHNIYFHKEITFIGGSRTKKDSESYWTLRKIDNITKINKHDKNPIQTTYELLWSEIINSDSSNRVTIYNSTRRILEYYFNTIGGCNYEKCLNDFEGEDKIICKALLSWINDGSHFINDDLEIDSNLENVDRYLKVFENIFTKLGHEAHYKMMKDRTYNILT